MLESFRYFPFTTHLWDSIKVKVLWMELRQGQDLWEYNFTAVIIDVLLIKRANYIRKCTFLTMVLNIVCVHVPVRVSMFIMCGI